jgi:type I restriction enzyme R subunit
MRPTGAPAAPEARARANIDRLLEQSGRAVQHRADMNLTLPVVAVREFRLERGHGLADYLLFRDGQAIAVCEAKPSSVPVRNIEVQAKRYPDGLPSTGDTMHNDRHPDLKTGLIHTKLSFNFSDSGGERIHRSRRQACELFAE